MTAPMNRTPSMIRRAPPQVYDGAAASPVSHASVLGRQQSSHMLANGYVACGGHPAQPPMGAPGSGGGSFTSPPPGFHGNPNYNPYGKPVGTGPTPYHLQPLTPGGSHPLPGGYPAMPMTGPGLGAAPAVQMVAGGPAFPMNGMQPMNPNMVGSGNGSRRQSFMMPVNPQQQMMYQQQMQQQFMQQQQQQQQAAGANPLTRRASFLAAGGSGINPQSQPPTTPSSRPGVPEPVPGMAPGLVRQPSILNRQSSFKKQAAPASSFPQQRSPAPQQQPPHTSAPPMVNSTGTAAPPLMRQPSILNRQSSFKKQAAPNTAFPQQQQQQQQQQQPQQMRLSQQQQRLSQPQQPYPIPNQMPVVTPYGQQQLQQQPPPPQRQQSFIGNRSMLAGYPQQQQPFPVQPQPQPQGVPPPVQPMPEPAAAPPALTRTGSILNRTSSFKNTKAESAEDTRKRHEAELARRQAQREAEIARARVEQQARDSEMRKLKEERLRKVMEKQRLRGQSTCSSPPSPTKESGSNGATSEEESPLPSDLGVSPSSSDGSPTGSSPKEAAPVQTTVNQVNTAGGSPPRVGSGDSNSAHRRARLGEASGSTYGNTSLFAIDDQRGPSGAVSYGGTPAAGAQQTPSKTVVPASTARVARTESPVAMVETPSPTYASGKPSKDVAPSATSLTPPTPQAAPPTVAPSPAPKATPGKQRSSTLVLYEIPLRRRKSAEKAEDNNPVKTYGANCNEIRVKDPADASAPTANFTVDELFAHRKSSTSMESKLLSKVTATVASGRSACVFSVDSAKLTPQLSSSPMDSPSWFAHQWMVSDLAEKFLAAKKTQSEDDYVELSVSFALIRAQAGGSNAVVSDLLQDSAVAKPAPLKFYETPLLGRCVGGVTYKALKEESDFVSIFAQAQSNASRVLCAVEESTRDASRIVDSVVVVVTCALTQRRPGRLPNLADTETWCKAEAKEGLDGGFMEDSDVDDVDAPDFLTRQPRSTHTLREGEGDLVRSCLTMVGVDDRFPLLLAPAEAASGKLPTNTLLDPCLRSWLKTLLVGPTLNVVMCSIDPSDPDAAKALEVQRTVAAVPHRPAQYSSCRRALARELSTNPLVAKQNGEAPMDVQKFAKEVESCRLFTGRRFSLVG